MGAVHQSNRSAEAFFRRFPSQAIVMEEPPGRQDRQQASPGRGGLEGPPAQLLANRTLAVISGRLNIALSSDYWNWISLRHQARPAIQHINW